MRTTYGYCATGRAGCHWPRSRVRCADQRIIFRLLVSVDPLGPEGLSSVITQITHRKSDNSVIQTLDYTYDSVGNRISLAESDGGHVTWFYDNSYQLTAEHRTGTITHAATFSYDPAGNRLVKEENGSRTTSTYDAANQLKTSIDSTGTTTYTYDANGNQEIVHEPTAR